MGNATTIRSATRTDLPRLQDIARRTISASYRSFLGDDAVDGYVGSGAADAYMAECLSECRVLSLDDVVIGFCVCKQDLIDLMMVDHEMHRRGYGTILLRDAERRLLSRYEEIRLESFEDNHPTNAFYRKNEWVERERRFDAAIGSEKIMFVKRRPQG